MNTEKRAKINKIEIALLFLILIKLRITDELLQGLMTNNKNFEQFNNVKNKNIIIKLQH